MMKYYNRTDIAKEIGVPREIVKSMRLPAPDARIGDTRVWSRETVNAIISAHQRGEKLQFDPLAQPLQYYTARDIADIADLSVVTIQKQNLPPADAMHSNVRGWLPETVYEWVQARKEKQK